MFLTAYRFDGARAALVGADDRPVPRVEPRLRWALGGGE